MSEQQEQAAPGAGGGSSGQVELTAAGLLPDPPMTITASGGLALPAIGASNG